MVTKMEVCSTTQLEWTTTRDGDLDQSREALPKNLICPLPYKIIKVSCFKDLLYHSLVHVDRRDGGDNGGDTNRER
jgi:hypothetical protein